MADVLEREFATLERERPHLEREHSGKYVLIHDDEIAGTYDDFAKAAEEGLRRFGSVPFLIRKIGAPDPSLSPAIIYGLVGGDIKNTVSS
jgi:hypothetical protein